MNTRPTHEPAPIHSSPCRAMLLPGMLDTNIVILRKWVDPGELPAEVPFDAEAARLFGRAAAAVVAVGRKPRRRLAGLMIASTAMAEGLPLFTTNADDFDGLDGLVRVISVTRPVVLDERDGRNLGTTS